MSSLLSSEMRWWRALNPAIYLISLLPGALVFVLRGGSLSHPAAFALAVLGVCELQHAINVLNDYTDWKRGADVEKYDSWVIFHGGNLRAARAHGLASLFAGMATGVLALFLVGKLWILLLAFPLVALGYFYNAGEKPLSYTPYAEWATGLCYGPGVFGCLWLMQSSINGAGAAGILAFSALSTAVLFSHQPPQVLTDSLAGKLSFAVRFGAEKARQGARGLLGLFFLASVAAVAMSPAALPLKLVAAAFALAATVRACRARVSPKIVLAYSSAWVVAIVALTSIGRFL